MVNFDSANLHIYDHAAETNNGKNVSFDDLTIDLSRQVSNARIKLNELVDNGVKRRVKNCFSLTSSALMNKEQYDGDWTLRRAENPNGKCSDDE